MIAVAGFGIGVIFGVFTASIDPMSTYATADAQPPSTRAYLKEMRARSMSYGKNFAVVGMMFAGIECMVESVSTLYWHWYFRISVQKLPNSGTYLIDLY